MASPAGDHSGLASTQGGPGIGTNVLQFGAIAGSVAGGVVQGRRATREAERDRVFQERILETQYQRTMADMRLAGLNPILAYQQGAGGGAKGSTAQVPEYGRLGAELAGTAVKIAKGGIERQLMKAQLLRTNAESLLTQQKTDESLSNTYVNLGTARKVRAEAQLTEDQLPASAAEKKVDETSGGELLRGIKRIKDAVNPFGGTAKGGRGR